MKENSYLPKNKNRNHYIKFLFEAFNKIKTWFSLKNISSFNIILNSCSIASTILYLLIPDIIVANNFAGSILILTIFADIFLIYFSEIYLNKNSSFGRRLNILCYLFLFNGFLTLLLIFSGNFIFPILYFNQKNIILFPRGLISINLLVLLSFGLLLSVFHLKKHDQTDFWDLKNFKKKKKKFPNLPKIKMIFKKILKLNSYFFYIFGICSAIVLITGPFEYVTEIIAAISGQLGLYLSLFLFANTILLKKLKKKKRRRNKFFNLGIIGFIIPIILLLPLFFTPLTINSAQKEFNSAFGNDWEEKIPEDANKYFLNSPFSISKYLLGISQKDYKVQTDIKYYEEEGLSLYFDVYMPWKNDKDLPGRNSTLIRIHGGGWASGDKGMQNVPQINYYFAAQGYIVFDIQYGLKDNTGSNDFITPSHVKGNFTLNDMINHIGAFTRYLEAHGNEYGANLESIFLSGGSSGGHLALVAGLCMSNGKFNHVFSSKLTIKGIIPYYPANGMANFLGVQGDEIFINPNSLIDSSSPACLIFQGTHDVLNYFNIAENIKTKYLEAGNTKCVIIWHNFAGHACEYYYPGYYNQISLYYLERFMYLSSRDLI